MIEVYMQKAAMHQKLEYGARNVNYTIFSHIHGMFQALNVDVRKAHYYSSSRILLPMDCAPWMECRWWVGILMVTIWCGACVVSTKKKNKKGKRIKKEKEVVCIIKQDILMGFLVKALIMQSPE